MERTEIMSVDLNASGPLGLRTNYVSVVHLPGQPQDTPAAAAEVLQVFDQVTLNAHDVMSVDNTDRDRDRRPGEVSFSKPLRADELWGLAKPNGVAQMLFDLSFDVHTFKPTRLNIQVPGALGRQVDFGPGEYPRELCEWRNLARGNTETLSVSQTAGTNSYTYRESVQPTYAH